MYTDGLNGAEEQQMPEVTPTSTFHYTTDFFVKVGLAPNISYTSLRHNAKGCLFWLGDWLNKL